MVQESIVCIGNKKSQRYVGLTAIHTTRQVADTSMSSIKFVFLLSVLFLMFTVILGKKYDSVCGTFRDGRHNAHQ